MNKMKEVAQLLGVELGEEFKLRCVGYKNENDELYRLTDKGLGYSNGWLRNDELNEIFTGVLEIIKIPWKPKDEETYFGVTARSVGHYTFISSDPNDLKNYIIGNCFRTEEEANANAGRIREKLKKMYDDGVQI